MVTVVAQGGEVGALVVKEPAVVVEVEVEEEV